MKLRSFDTTTFPVRLEILKTERARRARCPLTGRRISETLDPGTPVLIGTAGSKEVVVTSRDVREYDLAEATDAERATLEEYGFRWLIMG